ncbi:hypothetical protein PUP75_19765 [Pseudomonas chlororaphis]|uniref:hypothetical protein n=1 Tax=Pseudomonas chlororaphis TaxID=587753 RepID=UPI002368A631|nr:hypothetical protein [Pseudomonas chlororaphis]WDH51176.1 hypothetical protein PUP75_19765 [Pseudomonas chlororaphis]
MSEMNVDVRINKLKARHVLSDLNVPDLVATAAIDAMDPSELQAVSDRQADVKRTIKCAALLAGYAIARIEADVSFVASDQAITTLFESFIERSGLSDTQFTSALVCSDAKIIVGHYIASMALNSDR